MGFENNTLNPKSYQDKDRTGDEPDNRDLGCEIAKISEGGSLGITADSADLRLSVPTRATVSETEIKDAVKEFWGRDTANVQKASIALANLTELELNALAAFGFLDAADTPAARSWRDRLIRATVALSKIDSSLYQPALLLALRRKSSSKETDPLSPFTAVFTDNFPAAE